jgi:hypothetical protein
MAEIDCIGIYKLQAGSLPSEQNLKISLSYDVNCAFSLVKIVD